MLRKREGTIPTPLGAQCLAGTPNNPCWFLFQSAPPRARTMWGSNPRTPVHPDAFTSLDPCAGSRSGGSWRNRTPNCSSQIPRYSTPVAGHSAAASKDHIFPSSLRCGYSDVISQSRRNRTGRSRNPKPTLLLGCETESCNSHPGLAPWLSEIGALAGLWARCHELVDAVAVDVQGIEPCSPGYQPGVENQLYYTSLDRGFFVLVSTYVTIISPWSHSDDVLVV